MSDSAGNWPQRVALATSVYAIAGGALTLAGWWLDIPRLANWNGDGIPMFANPALAAVASGLSLAILKMDPRGRRIAAVLSVFVMLLGSLTLLEHLTGIDLGIDRWLVYREWGRTAAAAVPMRMGPPASTGFLAIGCALLLLSSTRAPRAVVALALTSMTISTLSLTGFAYGADEMYMLPRLTGISMQTATMIFALSVGLLTSVPERQPVSLLLDPGMTGLLARRVVPLVFLVPVTLGALRVRIQDAGLVDTSFGTAMRTVVEIVLLGALVWRGLVILCANEEALRKSEKSTRRQADQLGSFLDTAALAIHRIDQDGRILWANDAELQLVGCTRDQYVGRHIREFHEDQAALDDLLDRIGRGERIHEHRARLRCRDGTVKDVIIDSSCYREDGRFVHTQCFTRDVTRQVRGEESRALLASIVRASDDYIISKTLDGVISSWNAAATRLFGFTEEEAVGSRIDIIVPPERIAEERSILARIRRGESVEHFETVRRTKSGRLVDVSITVSPVRDADGRVIGASKIGRDISGRKREEAEREEASRRKDEFLAILAHELRNPLAPIRNAAHYLKGLDLPALHEPVGMIHRQVAQMARIVDDLLDVSRISRGVLELRRERSLLSEVIEAAVDSCRNEMRERRHKLEIDVPKEPVPLFADRDRLVQLLANLLANAAKYTPPAGRIELRVRVRGEMLELSVRDDGIGIPPAKLAEIFELFTRVDRALDEQGGLGIGLTLARQIAELHGGRIEARSEGIGCGSEFVVTLPVVTASPQVADSAPRAAAAAATPRRVVIADDNQDVAESLALLLQFAGHDVHTALDGEAAFERTKELRPDVALLDIGMPKANGYEVASRIRRETWGRDVVLVALTGWGQEADKRRAEEAGFDVHLVKPVSPETIERILEKLPESRSAAV